VNESIDLTSTLGTSPSRAIHGEMFRTASVQHQQAAQ
jgi:hypothetical protein